VSLPDVDAIIATSQAVAARIRGGSPRVVYPGVRATAAMLRSKQNGEIRIGAAARLVPVKGLDYLIQSMVGLRKAFPRCRLEIAGDGPARENLEMKARSLG